MREGPMFEAMIMNREINNPMYRYAQLHIRNVLLLVIPEAKRAVLLSDDELYFLPPPGFCLRTRVQHMYTTGGSSTPYYRFVFYLLSASSAQKFSGVQATLKKNIMSLMHELFVHTDLSLNCL